jgi:hypothetical protein
VRGAGSGWACAAVSVRQTLRQTAAFRTLRRSTLLTSVSPPASSRTLVPGRPTGSSAFSRQCHKRNEKDLSALD